MKHAGTLSVLAPRPVEAPARFGVGPAPDQTIVMQELTARADDEYVKVLMEYFGPPPKAPSDKDIAFLMSPLPAAA